MRKIIVVAFAVFLNPECAAQIGYDNGYFIDNSGNRHECQIRNVDWKNNPTQFEYRDSGSDVTMTTGISDVQEFGITGGVTYVRSVVKIDRSSGDLAKLTTDRNPVWLEEQLFLKALAVGKASLYSYQQGNLMRFFYRYEESPIQQLVFKRYARDNGVGSNNEYRQQIWLNLKCSDRLSNLARTLHYNEDDLLKYFQSYNQCNGASGVVKNPRQKGAFHLRLTPGLNVSGLRLANSDDNRYGDLTFPGQVSGRAGAELEFVLPYNRNKWALILEPGFQYFNGENDPGPAAGAANVHYQSIELPCGARYYFLITGTQKIFVDAFVGVGISFDSFFSYRNDPFPKTIAQRPNPAFGIGYHFDRLGLEFRYNINRNITSDHFSWVSRYKIASFIVGYRIR